MLISSSHRSNKFSCIHKSVAAEEKVEREEMGMIDKKIKQQQEWKSHFSLCFLFDNRRFSGTGSHSRSEGHEHLSGSIVDIAPIIQQQQQQQQQPETLRQKAVAKLKMFNFNLNWDLHMNQCKYVSRLEIYQTRFKTYNSANIIWLLIILNHK